MAIILLNKYRERAVIQEIPKCASDFIARVLEYNRIAFAQTHVPKYYNPPCDGWQYEVMGIRSSHCLPCEDSLYNMSAKPNRVCFIRHPLTWLQSWWRYKVEWDGTEKQGRSWREHSPFDMKCKSDDFQEFIDKYLEHYPTGLISHFFMTYINQSGAICKVENLKEDLRNWIGYQLGIEIDLDMERTNTSESETALYRPEQVDKILEREATILSLGKYDYVPDGICER